MASWPAQLYLMRGSLSFIFTHPPEDLKKKKEKVKKSRNQIGQIALHRPYVAGTTYLLLTASLYLVRTGTMQYHASVDRCYA